MHYQACVRYPKNGKALLNNASLLLKGFLPLENMSVQFSVCTHSVPPRAPHCALTSGCNHGDGERAGGRQSPVGAGAQVADEGRAGVPPGWSLHADVECHM